MHAMKRILSILLAVMLLTPVCAASAQTAIPAAQALADVLTEMDVFYVLHPAEASGTQLMTLDVSDDSTGLNCTIRIRFDETGTAELSVQELIRFSRSRRAEVIRACNDLNGSYMYTRFLVESDDTVTISLAVLLGQQAQGAVLLEALERFQSILNEAYPSLMEYDG